MRLGAAASRWRWRSAHPDRANPHRFEISGVDFNRDALHNRVEGEYHPKIVFLADQNAFRSRHRSGHDTDTLANHQIRMRLSFPLFDKGAQPRYFEIR